MILPILNHFRNIVILYLHYSRHGNNAAWFRRHKFGVFWVPQLAYALTAAKLRLVALDCKVCLFCANWGHLDSRKSGSVLGNLGYLCLYFYFSLIFNRKVKRYTSLCLVVLWLVPQLDPHGSAGVPAVPATNSMSDQNLKKWTRFQDFVKLRFFLTLSYKNCHFSLNFKATYLILYIQA